MAATQSSPARTANLRALARPSHLRRLLESVSGLLIDVDGVLVQQERAIPGAAVALAELAGLGWPYRLATNTSLVSRTTLARQAASLGLVVAPEQIVSALSATAALTARRFPGQPLFVICSADARREFAGQHLLDGRRADEAAGSCAAVVIGDSPAALSHANLDRAFRLVRAGARLVAMHRNPWWLTPRGPTLDAGAFVVGLEFATRRRALVAGKPSRAFFHEAVRQLGLAPAQVAIVGDDLGNDVAGGRRAGLRAVWVRSGRHDLAELAARAAQGAPLPDAVAADLAAVVAALPRRSATAVGHGPGRPRRE
ncbi:MAG: HAD-IIA family hydrolase [Candidatus Limnocylindrales bacterium]